MVSKKILLVFGTRPEAVKMAPVVLDLKKRRNAEVKVCVSGQHRELLDGVLGVFGITPDFDLNIMKRGQDLADISSALILGLREVFARFKADVVAVHGDTTTAFVCALAAYYQKTDVAHVEAGLRTNNIYSPFPEEGNRRMIDAIASFLFAPTPRNEKTLLSENVSASKIFVTGNTVIDALFEIRRRIDADEGLRRNIADNLSCAGYPLDKNDRKSVVITTHRRENIGDNLAKIYAAIKILADTHRDTDFLVVLHPNPVLARIIEPIVFGADNIKILRGVDYYSFVFLMSRAYIVMTDSGGIQEEAPSFGVPVFILRNETERPEGVECGAAKLVGADEKFIVSQVSEVLADAKIRDSMRCPQSPYGDGQAARRIGDILCG